MQVLVFFVLVFFVLAPDARSRPETDAPKQEPLGYTALVDAVRGHIQQSCRLDSADVEVRSVSGTAGAVPSEGEVEFRVRPRNLAANFHRVVIGVEALASGQPVRSFWVLVDATVRGRFVRAKRRIPFGAALCSDDLELAQGEFPDLRAEYFSDAAQVTGRISRRVLMPGDAVTRDIVSNPYIVRSGEMVRVLVQRGPVSISAMARAEQNGRLGEVVRIRNLEFERALKARVVAPGEVRVD